MIIRDDVEALPSYCPNCGANAVVLVCADAKVHWCENGHVSVTDGEKVKLVWDFTT